MLIDREYKIDYSDNDCTNEQPYVVKAKNLIILQLYLLTTKINLIYKELKIKYLL